MTVRIKRGETTLEADTLEEVVFLLRVLGLSNGHMAGPELLQPQQQMPLPLSRNRGFDAYDRFLGRLVHTSQKTLLRLLAQSTEPVEDKYLAEKLGVKNTIAVSGVFTSVKKQAKKEGLEPGDLFIKAGKHGNLKFTPTPKLREAVLRAISESGKGDNP